MLSLVNFLNTMLVSWIQYNSNDKDPKFKLDDHVKRSKYKNIFAKGYTLI